VENRSHHSHGILARSAVRSAGVPTVRDILASLSAKDPLRPETSGARRAIAFFLIDLQRQCTEPQLPLAGYRVIDMTRVLSGPFCSMILGDLGADVIKIEAPDGDTVRRQGIGRGELSWYFAAFNRNKRSVLLDLKTPEGRDALTALIAGADALVENFRPGVLARMGFDEARLQAIKPGLVTCGISGFGAHGPYRDRPAFDFIAQAMSGFMSTNGRADDPPLRSGLPISDLVAGLYGALGVTASLLRREKTGEGDHVDVSLTNSMISFLAYLASTYFATGTVPPRAGNDHPIAAPYGLFRTQDEEIAIAPADNSFFDRLVDALGLPELKHDPDFATNALRVQHRARLNALIEDRLMTESAAHWVAHLNAAGVPCGPVHGVEGVFADPQVKSQEMAIDVPHPGHGDVRMIGFPIKFANAPCRIRYPAPELGQHTEEILEALDIGNGGTKTPRA
jgi:CoA:oxalate CoA-transferase